MQRELAGYASDDAVEPCGIDPAPRGAFRRRALALSWDGSCGGRARGAAQDAGRRAGWDGTARSREAHTPRRPNCLAFRTRITAKQTSYTPSNLRRGRSYYLLQHSDLRTTT
eukprot:scaffold6902_cov73-Phaeocystis_antarctica.AAC.3